LDSLDFVRISSAFKKILILSHQFLNFYPIYLVIFQFIDMIAKNINILDESDKNINSLWLKKKISFNFDFL